MIKKKKNEKNQRLLSAMDLWKRRAETAEAELAEAKSSLAICDKAALRYADDLEATMKRERELRTELVALGQERVADRRELDFWVEESDRFRNEVVSLLREWAKEHPSAETDS